MLMKKKFIKNSKKWLLSIIRIKTKMIQMLQRLNSKRSQMHMKFYQIQIKENCMIWEEKKLSTKEGLVVVPAQMIFLNNSLEVVDLVVVASILILEVEEIHLVEAAALVVDNKKRYMKIFSKIQMYIRWI